MKANLVTLNVLTLFALAAVFLYGQGGDLTPSQGNGALDGANDPQPFMKTLGEVEPRTPIGPATTPGDADSLFKITAPGSYYLTGNITGVVNKSGIEIATDHVTLNLMGFALTGVAGSRHGVHSPTPQLNLRICNGTVRGWGMDGVQLIDPINCRLRDLNLSFNAGAGLAMTDGKGAVISRCVSAGNSGDGIVTGRAASIVNCAVYSNAGNGIVTDAACAITDCSVSSNGDRGIEAGEQNTISRCTARSHGNDGIHAQTGSTVSGCTASGNNGTGIDLRTGCAVSSSTASSNAVGFNLFNNSIIIGCTARSNTTDGIDNSNRCLVLNNQCTGNGVGGGAGISLSFATACRVEGNNVTENDDGIEATVPGNLIIRNSASNNGTDYDTAGGNNLGPIDSAATATSAWANISY